MGLEQVVDEALCYGDPARCNEAITEAHYLLSQALSRRTGRDAGANFHSWAVWGSQKAGVTIRQEDLTTALHDATWAGGCSGATVGLAVGHQLARLHGNGFWRALGLLTGVVCGSLSGRAIARWSRKKASRLILEGNRLVLDDIGRQTARFVTAENPMDFPQTVVQPLLRQAFTTMPGPLSAATSRANASTLTTPTSWPFFTSIRNCSRTSPAPCPSSSSAA